MRPATFGLKAVQSNSFRNLSSRFVGLFHTSSILRLLLLAGFSFIFFTSSVDKIFHLSGFTKAVGAYVLVPHWSASMLGLFIPLLELWIAIGLIVPLWREYAAALASGLLAVFAIALMANLHYGVITPCGCYFSLTLSLATRPHVVLDISMSVLAASLFLDDRLHSSYYVCVAKGESQ
jgi:uncharacterized membrane protein YphA (DoxX/SURF4 family)